MKLQVKLLILFVILLLSAQFSLAKSQTIILDRGESTSIDGINVTLIDYVKKDKKILVCVNDEKAILSDDKRVNKVYFEITSFRSNGVKLVLEADCDDCIESDNSICFLKKNNEINLTGEADNEGEDEIESSDEKNDEESDEENNKKNEGEVKSPEVKTNEKRYKGILQRIVIWAASLFR